MTEIIMRSAYDPHPRVQYDNRGPSLAKQSFTDECNINNIMAKYQKTGLIDHVAAYGAHYGDMPSNTDFQVAMNTVIEAKALFDSLPSSVRARFANNPEAYLEFVENPNNLEEMYSMGLLNRSDPGQGENTIDTPPASKTPDTPAENPA